MACYWLPNLTFKQIADLDPDSTIAIVPTGSMEQHGPHLPIGMDTMVAEWLTKAATESVSEAVDCLILPSISVGQSPEHIDYPGTVSYGAETYLKILDDTCACLARHGFKRILFVNGHGGNISMIGAAGFDARPKYDVHVFMFNVWAVVPSVAKDLIDRQGTQTDLHGGELETSMMLHMDPSLVRMEWAVDEENPKFAQGELITLTGPVTVNWSSMYDIAVSGISGQASYGSAEKGEAIMGYLKDLLSRAIVEISENW